MPLHRKFRNELGNVVVEQKLTPLYQLHYRNSGDRHHGPYNVVDSLILRRRFQSKIGKAVALVQQNAVATGNKHRRSNDVLLRDHALDES